LQSTGDWRLEVTLFAAGGRQVLMCRGSSLPATVGLTSGHVIVFDDITALVQAQRDAAWAEVARRLAHEIKNPLTPIQLASERMRRKLLGELPPEQSAMLDRSTHTIMQQVQALKEMVDAFNEYARPPQLKFDRLSINRLINEVLYLYRDAPGEIRISLDLDPADPMIEADTGRMRQLLHNLVKNSLEALAENRVDGQETRLQIRTRCHHRSNSSWLELSVEDNGPGFPDGSLGNVFEPYVTTKPKGSGLGLAIVRKIVEEHNGLIEIDSPTDGGARVVVRLPLPAGMTTATDVESTTVYE
jgi:nitrogen fixation/metabolism regulation signal transduction histidine kinase